MNKNLTVASALLVLIAGPALAQEDNDRAGDNRQGFYFGGGVGDFSAAVDEIDDLDDIDDVGIDFSDGDNATKLFGGSPSTGSLPFRAISWTSANRAVSFRHLPAARPTCRALRRASSARCRSGRLSCSAASA